MNICHDVFDRFQIYHSYASRPGKGVHLSLRHAQKFSRKNKWFLKLDVKQFFASINHEILKIQLAKRFKEHHLLYIFEQIIDSYKVQGAFGLPIGNLASQYFANHYMAELDHFIKEKLKCKAYVRYMDDMVLWHESKSFLKAAWHSIGNYLNNELRCNLKPVLINKVERGLPFCGFLIRPQNIRLSQ